MTRHPNLVALVPLVMAALAVVFYFLLIIRRIARHAGLYRRFKRRWRDECIHCGYNLRGNKSGRFPECGAEIPAH